MGAASYPSAKTTDLDSALLFTSLFGNYERVKLVDPMPATVNIKVEPTTSI